MDVPAPSTSRLLLSPGPVSPAAASHIRTALSKVDELWGDEAAIVQARAAKRSAASKQASEETERGHTRACSACRKGKIRCLSTSPLETCPRCQTLGLHCDYPEPRNRGPKKRLSKTHRLLRDIRRELEAALAEKPVIDPLEDGSDEEDELRHDDRSTSDEVQLLRNPLAILAEQACEASSPISPGSAAGGAPVGERYYEASLYLSRPESNFALDPVTAGILNLEELDRLIRLYFVHLRPFIFLLNPNLHTATFLRHHSPFLTTAIASVAATFDPQSAHNALALAKHARRLMLDILDSGLKSLEIVQGFFILSHWAAPEEISERDRAWQILGFAWRMAIELRISLPLHNLAHVTYRNASEIGLEVINRNRQLTWNLLFCAELAMTVQTGCIDILRAPPIPDAASYSPTNLPLEYPNYNYAANVQVNSIFTRMIHLASDLRRERGSDKLRETFVAAWKPEMEAWKARWPNINPFVDIHAEGNVIILNLVSLRFAGGSAQPILAECKAAALRTLHKINSWQDPETELLYCSNYVVVHIAYAAVLLIQLEQRFQHGVSAEVKADVLRMAEILEVVGKNRPNAFSAATLHAQRIKRLVASLSPPPQPAAPLAEDTSLFWSGPPMPPTFPAPSLGSSCLPPPLPEHTSAAGFLDATPQELADVGPLAEFASSDASWSFPTEFNDYALPMMGLWGWPEPGWNEGGEAAHAG